MFGSMAETAGLFVAYSQLQTFIRWLSPRAPSDDLSIVEHGLAAGGAGFLTSFILSVYSSFIYHTMIKSHGLQDSDRTRQVQNASSNALNPIRHPSLSQKI